MTVLKVLTYPKPNPAFVRIYGRVAFVVVFLLNFTCGIRPNFYARFANACKAGVEEKGVITELGEQGVHTCCLSAVGMAMGPKS